MPQPAIHLLLASEQLRAWRIDEAGAPIRPRDGAAPVPFDAADDDCANAFLVGSLGPDLGLFPGGDVVMSRLAHTGRTGALLRSLLTHAQDPAQRAFAWGWLSHITADVAIHPLVNAAAADHAHSRGVRYGLADHVRVEVGLDAWFAWQHPLLTGLTLRPAFDRDGWRFVAAAFRTVCGHDVGPSQLLQMQRGMLRFTHLALHFATAAARALCWSHPADEEVPPLTALTWRFVSLLSMSESVVHAYLNPAIPGPQLLAAVEHGMTTATRRLDGCIEHGVDRLADYDLETGAVIRPARAA
jgi:hypothetical protein